ncbi:hypothetical protein [Streptomyces sp. NPDC054838]
MATSSPMAQAAAAADPASRPVIALADAFPAQVPDGAGGAFTRVGSAALASCPEPGTVGPRLAGYIAEGKGCAGEQTALYKDVRGDHTGGGRAMVVALGQWSDGRGGDYRQLVDRMQPLQDAVARAVGRYENAR